MKLKKTILLIAAMITVRVTCAQSWFGWLKTEKQVIYNLKKASDDYWLDKEINDTNQLEHYNRWEWFWENRTLTDGAFPDTSIIAGEWKKYINLIAGIEDRTQHAANWKFIGPETSSGGFSGLGRVSCIAFHPKTESTFWVGTPAGGLWETNDSGETWQTYTNHLPSLGISDIAIDPVNPNNMFIATGDGDFGSLKTLNGNRGGDTQSIGVLKSTDGGATWSRTGLNWRISHLNLIRRLIINPVNPKILIAATSDGLWITADAGLNWTQKLKGTYFIDADFKPGNPAIIYAATYSTSSKSSAQLYRSTDAGNSWSKEGSFSGISRINIGVTPANPDLVMALCSNMYNGFGGLWRSVDSGNNFTQFVKGDSKNNYLCNSKLASGAYGQAWYDLAFAINPANEKEMWMGGVNTWNSVDGGLTWNLNNFYKPDTSVGVPIVHADKHFLAFHPLKNNFIYECNDGGVYMTNDKGKTWTDLSDGLQISQIYRIGVSQASSRDVMAGMQDNGTRQLDDTIWYDRIGGDGMECLIDFADSNTCYGTYSYGLINRTTDNWNTQVTISDNIPLDKTEMQANGLPMGAWVTPYVMHPLNSHLLFAGYSRVYKTNDRGDSWKAISPFLTSDNIRALAVAPSDSNVIYAATFDTLHVTFNGGLTWKSYASGIKDAKYMYLAVHPDNPLTVWVALSGYAKGWKVLKSIDGGNHWINISGALPNVPVNCIVYQNGSNDGLYIGTDLGVFYRNATMLNWTPYNHGLPHVVVTELEISYPDKKLWAGTFGRGLWNTGLFPAAGK
ncbi:MAG: hypothetical protein ACHQNT_05050 [Bacteroidia bacterium]